MSNRGQPESEPAVDAGLSHARELQSQGRLAEAEAAYRTLLDEGVPREPVLRALVEIHMRNRRVGAAVETLVALTEEVPDSLYYYARLAALLEGLGEPETAITHYERLIQRRPDLADAHFNVALLYRKVRDQGRAIAAYQAAIRLDIAGVEEAWSNLGVLLAEQHDAAGARDAYQRAVTANPAYLPALFNLAGLHEEVGERAEAISLYEQVLVHDPRHWASLARLAHATRVTVADTSLLVRLEQAIAATMDEPAPQESLLFALGKVLDDLGRYDEAFRAYRNANRLGSRRHDAHDRTVVEGSMDRIIELIDDAWIRSHATELTARPVFICGMFRSGSTLVEQVLAAHPGIMAGGELDLLPWLVQGRIGPWPRQVAAASRSELEGVGHAYLDAVAARFPGAGCVTDKQPQNFLRIGLIKAIFPGARIIHTRRNLPDTCLSIYFQQLDGQLSHATDLDDIAHYHRQHDRLMAHWRQLFPDSIHTVDYDELVRSPRPVLEALLAFLGLPWDERCLQFKAADVQVKTASVWQVREDLHDRSSGRWKHYRAHLGALGSTLAPGQ